jgi:glucose/arabinose dehydrogenase
MGADHLGNDKPDDSMYIIRDGFHYGWSYCYRNKGKFFDDASQQWERKPVDCQDLPNSFAFFDAHSAPLGLEYFGLPNSNLIFKNAFLVALHGSGQPSIGNGYNIVRVNSDGEVETFIDGFLQDGQRVARPVDILQVDGNSFFFTDDFGGRIFYVYKK